MESATKPRAKLIPAKQVFAEFRKQPGYQEAYDALEDEFAMLIELA